MNSGKSIFAQLMEFLPIYEFRKCVKRYDGNYKVKSFTCWEQFLCMSFAQLTYRESLRDIEACLRAAHKKLYHMGIRSKVSRNTLANANQVRDWRIYADFAQVLIGIARKLYMDEDFGVELQQTAYALGATIIDLCLSLFPWAKFRNRKGAVKLHTLMDLRGSIPVCVIITHGIQQISASFVTRAKSNFKFKRLYSNKVDKSTGVQCDQIIVLTGFYAKKDYPDKLRRIRYYDAEHNNTLVFLTNNFTLPALTVAKLYRCRWQVELFFKWIKQHLRIKAFYGTTENAVKTQIWVAISVYVLVAIIKKRLNLEHSLYTILQILSVTLLEKIQLLQAFSSMEDDDKDVESCNQLNLFN
jgi:IS4 transposase